MIFIKRLNILGKSIPVSALAILLIGASLVSAGVLNYYGQISGTATVEQSVLLDGNEQTTIEATYEGETYTAGDTVIDGGHYLTNNAGVSAPVEFETTYSPDGEGITTKYYELSGTTETVEEANGHDLDSNDFCAINNNVDFETSYEGDNVVFKIHTPDGFEAESCCSPEEFETKDDTASFAFDLGDDGGTGWDGYDFQVMYEPDSLQYGWSDTDPWGYANISDGWHTDHYKLSNVEGVSAEKEGDYLVVNVSIDKLGGIGSDYGNWIKINDHTGLCGCPDSYGGPDQLEVTPEEIDGKTVGTEITEPVTLGAGESFDFAVTNEFAVGLIPDDYTITSKVVPQ